MSSFSLHCHLSWERFSRCAQPEFLAPSKRLWTGFMHVHPPPLSSVNLLANRKQRNPLQSSAIPKPFHCTSLRLGESSISPQWPLKCEIKIGERVCVLACIYVCVYDWDILCLCVPVEQKVNKRPVGATISHPQAPENWANRDVTTAHTCVSTFLCSVMLIFVCKRTRGNFVTPSE